MSPRASFRLLRASIPSQPALLGLAAALLIAWSPAAAQRVSSAAPRESRAASSGAPGAEPPAVVRGRLGQRFDRVLYDEPGDGATWAVGASWKARFDECGATYYPCFGKRAPHDVPHSLSPYRVESDGAQIAFERAATPVRRAERVEIDRGAFVERYDLGLDQIEQSFVFASLPSRGELVVRLPIPSELEARETDAGVEFRSEFGRVAYERAVAVDALGRRSELRARLEGGTVVLRVAADFLARAELPLVVDPVVTTVMFGINTDDDTQADVAWDPVAQVWLVSYEKPFSASESDVYCETRLPDGNLVMAQIVDVTQDSWVAPRCADVAALSEFLVVAEVVDSASHHIIRGRIVTPNGTQIGIGAPITISDSTSGNKRAPTVGGDPYLQLRSSWCVAYVQDLSSTDSEIVTVAVPAVPGALLYPPHVLAHVTGLPDTEPSISKSNDGYTWTLAWRRANGVNLGDIWAAHFDAWDGSLADGPFGVTVDGAADDYEPCASSPLHNSTPSGVSAIAFAHSPLVTHRHVSVALVQGTNVLQIVDVAGLEPNGNPTFDQIEPAIDSDGQHFLVSYSELSPSTNVYAEYATNLYFSVDHLGVTESHVPLLASSTSERNAHVCAAHDVNSTSRSCFVAYERDTSATDHDVFGTLLQLLEGGSSSAFCFGSNAACPCGNGGSGAAGCGSSVSSAGAQLVLNGTPSTIDDSVLLIASGMPPSVGCLFFQGSSSGGPAAFGDGLRCATGTIRRLGVKTTSSLGSALYPSTTDALVSARGMVPPGGGRFAYQTWYRNAASFCTSATFNLTNGVLVNWAH